MPECPPGRRVEAPAGPELDQGGRTESQRVDRRHRPPGRGPRREGHDPDGNRDRDGGLRQEQALIPLLCHPRLELRDPIFAARDLGGLGPHVVAGRGDRVDDLLPTDDVGSNTDGGPLGREIDECVLHARRSLHEALDAVDARLHTPREYTSARVVPPSN